jgi:hypothetical protein
MTLAPSIFVILRATGDLPGFGWSHRRDDRDGPFVHSDWLK